MVPEFYLLALVPNQQVRFQLQDLRHKLYQKFGLISALALEPMMPLCILYQIRQKDKIISLLSPPEQSPVKTPSFSLTEPVLSAEYLFLGLEDTAETTAIKKALKHISAEETALSEKIEHPAFPLSPGLFLAHMEGQNFPAADRFIRAELQLPFRWKSSRIVLYSVAADFSRDSWWEGIQWNMVWQFPFKKSLS